MGRRIRKDIPDYKDDLDLINKYVSIIGNGKDENKLSLNGKNILNVVNYNTDMSDYIKEIEKVLPNVKLSMEILTSLIVSPNDMLNPDLRYSLNNLKLPTNIKSYILDVLRIYITGEYNYLEKLENIVKEVLFVKGSYAEANIPISDIEDLIKYIRLNAKASLESINYSYNPKRSVKKKSNHIVEISDNIVPVIEDVLNEYREDKLTESMLYGIDDESIGISLESVIVNGDVAMFDKTYNIDYDTPIIKILDSNKLVPIIEKGNPKKHLGYVYIVDYERTKSSSTSSAVNIQTSNILNKIKKNLSDFTKKPPEFKLPDEVIEKIYINEIKDYISSIRNTNIDIDLVFDNNLKTYLLDSLLKKNKVNIVYLPKELVSYFAVEYRENGTGKTITENLLGLLSLRSIIMFVELLAYIKSSVTTTEVNVELDPNDPYYNETMEKIKDHVLKTRQLSLPVGMLKLDDLSDWVHKLGFNFNFKHPSLPDMNIDVEEKTFEIRPIDSDLKEELDRLIISGLYLTPELVNEDLSPDFATTVIANNKLLAKRILSLQNKFNVCITNDIRKKLRLDKRFKEKIKDVIKANYVNIKKYLQKQNPEIKDILKDESKKEDVINWLVRLIIENIKVTFPKPEVTEDTNVRDAFSNYKDLVEEVTDILFDTSVLTDDLVGDISEKADMLKGITKVTLLRKYIADNGLLPELENMFTIDENGETIENPMQDFVKIIEALYVNYIQFNKINKKVLNKLENRFNNTSKDNDEDSNNNISDNTDNTNNTNNGNSNNSSVDKNNNNNKVNKDNNVKNSNNNNKTNAREGENVGNEMSRIEADFRRL